MRTLTLTAVLAFILVSACDSRPDDEPRLTKLGNNLERHAIRVDQTSDQAQRLAALWEAVRLEHEDAAAASVAAHERLQHTAELYTTASSQFTTAARVAEQADTRWRIYKHLVLIATAIDSANLDAARAATARSPNTSIDCDNGMSTAAYRALLAAQGVSTAGMDVDHIVPQSLGGADHPENYQLLPSSTNRGLGNTWNEQKCFSVGEDRCARAIASSRTCGSLTGLGF